MPLGLSVSHSKGIGNDICQFDIRKPQEQSWGLSYSSLKSSNILRNFRKYSNCLLSQAAKQNIAHRNPINIRIIQNNNFMLFPHLNTQNILELYQASYLSRAISYRLQEDAANNLFCLHCPDIPIKLSWL